jgi:hypothetical protein
MINANGMRRRFVALESGQGLIVCTMSLLLRSPRQGEAIVANQTTPPLRQADIQPFEIVRCSVF